MAKAHRLPVVLTFNERDAVLSALRIVLEDAPTDADRGLAQLVSALEKAQVAEVDEPAPPRRTRSTKKQ